MRRYLSLILLVGLAYPKTDSDKLVLKSGVEYLGKFEKTENGFIYFKPKGEFGYQPVEIDKVDTLLLFYESPYNSSKKHNVTFGLFSENKETWFKFNKKTSIKQEEINKLINERNFARKNKDFKKSDEIRDYLLKNNILLEDTENETTWKFKKWAKINFLYLIRP